MVKAILATCHPEAPNFASGLCRSCYSKQHRDKDKVLANTRMWRAKHPDKLKAQLQRYRSRHPEKIREWSRKYYETHPTTHRHGNLRTRYGLSTKDYERMYELQEGKCAICHDFRKTLDVDHNHRTGEVRGLLCNPCNRVLGVIEKSYNLGATIEAFYQYLNRKAKSPQGVYG